MKQAPRTPEEAVERVKKLQKNLLKLLYLAMALHVLGKFFLNKDADPQSRR